MAKGDVVLKFDANTAEYIQRVMAARSALDETAKKARETGEAVKKAGDHVDDFGRKISHGVKELAGLLAIPTTVMGALDLTMQAVEKRIARAEERARTLNQRSATFDQAMYTLGTGRQTREIRDRVGSLSGKYAGLDVDDDKLESLFSQIVSGVGRRATVDQFMTGTRSAAIALGMGASDAAAVQTGSAATILQSLMPGMDADQADAIARFMQLNAPDVLQNEKILGTIATSKDKMGTARFFASGYQNFQGAKRIKPLSDFVESHPGMDYDKILANPFMLPPAERSVLEAIRAGESKLRDVPGTSIGALNEVVAGRDDISRSNVVYRNALTAEDQLRQTKGPSDTDWASMRKRGAAGFEEKYPRANYFFPDPLVQLEMGLETSDFGSAFLKKTGFGDAPGVVARDQVLEELRRSREATERMADTLRQKESDPMLRNGKDGQQ